jgi:hypothetical protein
MDRGTTYLRLAVPDHAMPEGDALVDQFVAAMVEHQGKWFHFHCRGGKGRTTTFMSLYDALMNADLLAEGKLGWRDVVNRQGFFGGSNLMSYLKAHEGPTVTAKGDVTYKVPLAQDRANFIRNFCAYVAAHDPVRTRGYTSWSTWCQVEGPGKIKCSLEGNNQGVGKYPAHDGSAELRVDTRGHAGSSRQ